MKTEINPQETTRGAQFEIWKNAPNPMVTIVTRLDVTRLVRMSRKRHLKFNMLMDYCIGKAAVGQKEFYLMPEGDKLMKFDSIAINTMVKNHTGELSSCDIRFVDDLEAYSRDYERYTSEVARTCIDRDLSDECMVIDTSAIVNIVIEAAGGVYNDIFNNPFMIWGKYSRRFFRYYLNVSFMFHHTQMDGAHAGAFLANVQKAIDGINN